ncbi:MAG: hypothetical protein E7426_01720 [Ruminococcaceae bacterium]|jgi:hypothetical protein|nr:hypothetical protein [Oscillospiraceae bacterium]
MFGYVRPALDKLDEADKDRFQAAYCGLCHTLGRRYGLMSRFFLNYDLAFLAMLLEKQCAVGFRSCAVHPIRKRPCACSSAALDTAADYSVILLWWQLQDGISDRGFFGGLKYRAAARLLRRAYQLARQAQPEFDAHTQTQLTQLAALERENCSSVDRPADTFARLLSGVSAAENDPIRQRVLEQLLYHLGRWIYIIDAADDLENDLRLGCYNPVALRFPHEGGKLTEVGRQEVAGTLDQSVRMMAAAYELTDFGAYSAVIESIVYEGLYLVGAAVLNGTFHRRPKREKR